MLYLFAVNRYNIAVDFIWRIFWRRDILDFPENDSEAGYNRLKGVCN